MNRELAVFRPQEIVRSTQLSWALAAAVRMCMREFANTEESSKLLARRGLISSTVLAGTGSALGAFAILHGAFSVAEVALVVSSG